MNGPPAAALELPPTAAVDLAVHNHVAIDDGLFHIAAGVEEPGELQKLPETDGLAADRDVVEWNRVGHAAMLANAAPPAGRAHGGTRCGAARRGAERGAATSPSGMSPARAACA